MKFELSRPTDYSDEAFIAELKRVSKMLKGQPLTISNFDRISKYSATTIRRRFGGWFEALEKAAIEQTLWPSINKKIPQEHIIDELLRVAGILGTDTFSRDDFENNSKMTKHVFKNANSFNILMKKANLSPLKTSRRYTDDECFENLLKVWTYYGRQPSFSDINKPPSVVGSKAYIARWGSWTKALLAFLDKVNKDVTMSEEVQNIDSNVINKKINLKPKSVADLRNVPIGLRFDIFKRDRYRCVKCGRSPATQFDVKELQADHIIPFSKGGKTVKENLQTLCNECNSGKSNKTE